MLLVVDVFYIISNILLWNFGMKHFSKWINLQQVLGIKSYIKSCWYHYSRNSWLQPFCLYTLWAKKWLKLLKTKFEISNSFLGTEKGFRGRGLRNGVFGIGGEMQKTAGDSSLNNSSLLEPHNCLALGGKQLNLISRFHILICNHFVRYFKCIRYI